MNLLNGKMHETYRVIEVKLQNKRLERRLEMLGVIAGTDISVLNKKNSGTMIFKVRGTRFAIGREIAAGIFVEVIK